MSNEEAQLTDGLGLRRAARAAMWLALNGAFAALLWFGFVEGVEGARNLSLFLVWANFIVSWGMLVPDIQKELAKKGRSVPKAANALYDLGVTFFLAWFGAWVSVVAYVVHIVLQEAGWYAALTKMECGCDFRTRLVGDGCPVCNPRLAAEIEAEIAEDEAKYRKPPCQECGAMTPEEAGTKCNCGGDKDDCHGCHLWPD